MPLDDEWVEDTGHPAHPVNQPARATSSDDGWVEDTAHPAHPANQAASDQDWQEVGQKPMGWGEYLGRGATGAVPYVAGAAGGAAGTGLGLPGTLGGGAMGYMAGKEGERILNHYLFGDDVQEKPMEQLARVANNGKEGVEQEMLGMGSGKAIESAAPYLKTLANKFGILHLRPTPAVAQKLGPEKLGDIAESALENKSIPYLGKAAKTAENLDSVRSAAWDKMSDMINSSDAKVDPMALVDRMDKEVIEPLKATSGNEALIQKLEEQKDSFMKRYAPKEYAKKNLGVDLDLPDSEMPVSELEAQRRIEDKRIPKNQHLTTESPLNIDAQKDFTNVLRTEGENAIDDPAFKGAKTDYHLAKLGQDMAGRTAALTNGGTGLFGHMTDTAMLMEGLRELAHGNLSGLGLIGGRLATKGRTASTLARGAYDASKVAASPAGQAAGNYLSRPVWHTIRNREK